MTLIIAAKARDGTIVTISDAQGYQQGRVTEKGYFLEGISVRKVRPISSNAILGVSGDAVIVEDVFGYFQTVDKRCKKAGKISENIKRKTLSYTPISMSTKYIFCIAGTDNSRLLATPLGGHYELSEASCCSVGCYQGEASRLLSGYSSEMGAQDVRDFLADAYNKIVLFDKKLGDRRALSGRQLCTLSNRYGFQELEFDGSGCTRSIFRVVA